MRCFNPAKDFLLNLCKIHKDFVEKNENLCRKEIHRQKKPLKPSDLASEFEPSMTGFVVILNLFQNLQNIFFADAETSPA